MYRYDEVADLTGDAAERVHALIERSSEIWDMPDDMGTVEAWEQQVADCEAEGVPHLAASARFGQFLIFVKAAMAAEATEYYVRLMQIVSRYGDHIHPENLGRFLGEVASLAARAMNDPTVPVARVERVVDLVEQQVRARGLNLADVHLARAHVAADLGRQDQMLTHLDRWQMAGDPGWPPLAPGTVMREQLLLSAVDPHSALEVLERRLAAMGVAPGPLDPTHPDVDELVHVRLAQALLYARLSRPDVTRRIGDELVDRFGTARLIEMAAGEHLVVVLEHRPADALTVTDHLLAQLALDSSGWREVAGVARARILADPAGEEGRMLMALAAENAARHDERAGGDLHTRELTQFWAAGLPAGPRPAVLDRPEVWDDVEERGEAILRAGWLRRLNSGIDPDHPPIVLKMRYRELGLQAMAVLEADTDDEARTIAAHVETRAAELRMATAAFAARLFAGLRAAQHGDLGTFLDRYAAAQEVLLAEPEHVLPGVRHAAERTYVSVVTVALASPDVTWRALEAIMSREVQVRTRTVGPVTHLLLARAKVAAQIGDGETLRALIGEIDQAVEDESDDVDRFDVDLEVVAMVEPYSPDYGAALMRRVVALSNDAEQVRAARMWAAWLTRDGAAPAATDVDDLLELVAQAEGDTAELGAVPEWVVLDLARDRWAGRPRELLQLVDAVLTETWVPDAEVFAAAGRVLGEVAPQDPRGASLTERARELAARLDARDGTAVSSTDLRRRWLPQN